MEEAFLRRAWTPEVGAEVRERWQPRVGSLSTARSRLTKIETKNPKKKICLGGLEIVRARLALRTQTMECHR